MKIEQFLLGLLLGVLVGFGVTKFFTNNLISLENAVNGTEETTESSDTATWKYDERLDAVKAAPDSHKIVYEDSSVRVLQVILDEHKIEPIHTHKYKSIIWFTQATPMAYYRYELSDKKSTIKDSISIPEMPEKALNVGGLMDSEGPHAVENLGDKKGIAYRIEFKKDNR